MDQQKFKVQAGKGGARNKKLHFKTPTSLVLLWGLKEFPNSCHRPSLNLARPNSTFLKLR